MTNYQEDAYTNVKIIFSQTQNNFNELQKLKTRLQKDKKNFEIMNSINTLLTEMKGNVNTLENITKYNHPLCKSLSEEEIKRIENDYNDFDVKFINATSDIYLELKKFKSNPSSLNDSIHSNKSNAIQIDNSQLSSQMQTLVSEIKQKLKFLNKNLQEINSSVHSQGERISTIHKNNQIIETNQIIIENKIDGYTLKDKLYSGILHAIAFVLALIIIVLTYEKIN